MRYITIPNFESFQHYKDRRPTWIKLLIEIVEEFDHDGKPKKFFKMSDSAKWTFIALLCLRANYNGRIPYPSDKWLKERCGIQSLSLQPLVDNGFIAFDTESVSNPYESGTPEKEKEREKEKEKEYMSIFDKARLIFPGTRRGCKTEFDNFKKHADWKDAVSLLAPAIEREKVHKKRLKESNQFCPVWKNFQTWINRRCWEEDHGGPQGEKSIGYCVTCCRRKDQCTCGGQNV